MPMRKQPAFIRRNIQFDADGTTIRGWLYRPGTGSTKKGLAAVVMAHGFAAVKEMCLDRFAEVFVRAGLAVVVFDFRGLGASDGEPRQEIDPWRQIEDYRHAITYASTRPEIDPERIGVWGTSYAGGHVQVAGATDKRVKCVVAQIPTISGYLAGLRRVPMDRAPALTHAFAQDRVRRMKGGRPAMRALVGDGGNVIYPSDEVRDWYLKAARHAPNWRNEVTLRTLEFSRAYEPGGYISQISPAPLLMIVADRDVIVGTDLQLDAFLRALEPKKLVLLPGGHFAPYVEQFEPASQAAAAWFTAHL